MGLWQGERIRLPGVAYRERTFGYIDPLGAAITWDTALLHNVDTPQHLLAGNSLPFLHVGSLMLDSYAKLTVTDVVVPFLGAFKPFWQGLGTVAFDLVLALIVTGLLRQRIGQRTFRAVHWFSYAMWPIALAHAIGNGTNGTSKWFLVLAAGSVAAVGAAVAWRLSTNFLETAKARTGALR
ncbi:hypothetical protein NHF46_08360 [Arthrobacter alpinus]|nr:hypothetical protein [Arthrobacter alpinus]